MTAARRVALAAAAWTLLALTPARAEPDALEPYLETVRIERGLPGVAAAVVKGGEVVAIGATGVRALGRPEAVTREDRFHLGSNTKAMTATIAGALVEEGRIGWDTPLGSVLGEAIPGMNEALAAVTLGTLLSHTSGIPSDNDEIVAIYQKASDDTDGDPAAQRIAAVAAFKDHAPKVPEGGSPFSYANLGYVAAGAMLETVSGTPWERLLFERIFEPLGMEHAGIGATATFGLYDAPVGHLLDNATGAPTPIFWGSQADIFPLIGPAGLAHMSVGDYARWAAWNAGGGRRGPAIVSPETLETIHAAKVTMPPIKSPMPGTPTSGAYAYGWGVVTLDWADRPLLTHNGSNSMNFATVYVDTGLDLAVVVLMNYPGRTAEEACFEIAKHLYAAYATEH